MSVVRFPNSLRPPRVRPCGALDFRWDGLAIREGGVGRPLIARGVALDGRAQNVALEGDRMTLPNVSRQMSC